MPHHDSVGEVYTGKQTSSSKDYTHLNQLQEKTACYDIYFIRLRIIEWMRKKYFLLILYTHIWTYYTRLCLMPTIHIYTHVWIYIQIYFRTHNYIRYHTTPIIQLYILVQSYIRHYLCVGISPAQENTCHTIHKNLTRLHHILHYHVHLDTHNKCRNRFLRHWT